MKLRSITYPRVPFARRAWANAGRLLAWLRYRKWPNPYDQFRALPDSDLVRGQSKGGGKRILLLPIRVSPTSNLLEGLVGAGLKLDGHDVWAVMDGGVLRYSENATYGKSWLVANALSVFEQGEFARTFGVEPCYYSNYIDAGAVASFSRALAPLSMLELRALTHDGIELGRHAWFGLMRYLRQEDIEDDGNAELLRQFMLTAFKTAMVVRAVAREKQITHAFLSHGVYTTWGVATDVLVAEGIEVTVWARGYVGGNMIFARNQTYLLEAIEETRADVQRYLGSHKIDDDFLADYFGERVKGGSKADVAAYYAGSSTSGAEAATLAKGATAVVGIFPNIPWDGSMYAASEFTPSLRAFARRVVDAARAFPKLRFVVRCHPAETHRLGNDTRESFSSFFDATDRSLPNLTIIEPDGMISSYELIPVIGAAITFGSTMGLELSYRGIPVLQTGIFHLSNKGAVFEIRSESDLYDKLSKLEAGVLEMSEEMRDNIRKYAYYHIRLCHVHDDMTEIERYRYKGYAFARATMLAGDSLKSCGAIKQFVLGETEKCLNPYA